ncbi:MAG: hypothetical protein VKL59_22360 [Nostocaceae cyanobacterium]|nr:hypothetical protein [Nostocaceae cyanobacterium]
MDYDRAIWGEDLAKNSFKLLFLCVLCAVCGSFFRYLCVSPVGDITSGFEIKQDSSLVIYEAY